MDTETQQKLTEANQRIADLERRLSCSRPQPDYRLSSWVENGHQYYRCAGCGKVIKEGRWLGTMHLCA